MDELRRDLLQQIPHARGVPEVDVRVVDEDQEDAPGSVARGTRGRQQQPFLCGCRRRADLAEDAAAVREQEHDQLLPDAVFEDLEIILAERGHELPELVSHRDVGGDEIDAAANDGRPRLLNRLGQEARGKRQGSAHAVGS